MSFVTLGVTVYLLASCISQGAIQKQVLIPPLYWGSAQTLTWRQSWERPVSLPYLWDHHTQERFHQDRW